MDYDKIGLKAGLEIHQQLDTGKLFCKCPGILRKDEPDFVVKRKLHAVAGEEGEIDVAVKHEAMLDKEFEYQGYDDSTCLVELDEEPPHEINEGALEEALKIALLLNCEIYPVSQIMRKTVIDGSNTSGFQRTVLIGHEGYFETSFGKVRIETIALEEDACRIVNRGEKKVVFRLDRLGIPLVEITTKPDMKTAEEIKEAALKLGEIVRAAKVKRGLGTIRQDVNISIKKHDRVEIKGFQDPKMMIKTINEEIKRQQKEIKDGKKEGEVRNALKDGKSEFLRPIPGKARMYPETDLPLLKIGREMINDAKNNLPMMKSEMEQYLKKEGLKKNLVDLVVKDSELLDEYRSLMKVYGKNPNLIGKMITLWRDDFAKKFKLSPEDVEEKLNENVYESVLEGIKDDKIEEGDVQMVLEKVIEGVEVEDALKVEKVESDELEEDIRNILKEKPGLRPNAYMGLVMAKFKGKINPKEAMEIIGKILD